MSKSKTAVTVPHVHNGPHDQGVHDVPVKAVSESSKNGRHSGRPIPKATKHRDLVNNADDYAAGQQGGQGIGAGVEPVQDEADKPLGGTK